MLIATVSLYVMLANVLAFYVGMVASPNSEYIAYRDIVVRPMGNSSSLCDVKWVPNRTKDRWLW